MARCRRERKTGLTGKTGTGSISSPRIYRVSVSIKRIACQVERHCASIFLDTQMLRRVVSQGRHLNLDGRKGSAGNPAMNARHVRGGGPAEVKKKEEEGLITLMKERAVVRCKTTQKEYYDCVKDRTVSIVWACRAQANAMNECLHEHTTDEVLEDLKYRWVKAGKPSFWDRGKMPKF